jgi:hypothetical protein
VHDLLQSTTEAPLIASDDTAELRFQGCREGGGGGEAVNIKGGIDKCEVEPGEEEEQRPGRRSRGGDGSCVRPVAR